MADNETQSRAIKLSTQQQVNAPDIAKYQIQFDRARFVAECNS
jgi:hypothetical protein